MEALRTHDIGKGGEKHMESALTDIDGKTGRDVKEVYVGPSALWIAKLIPRRVDFREGWFWTTTEICHEGRSDGLAFRQSPDGNGIDVRCHTRGCSRDVAMAGLETATGCPSRTHTRRQADPLTGSGGSGTGPGRGSRGTERLRWRSPLRCWSASGCRPPSSTVSASAPARG